MNPGPLKGMTVIDLSNMVAGGTTTSHLADFGARVIKVERPEVGDPIRAWGPFKDGESIWWNVLSRNKESITLNLNTTQGQDILKTLISQADILVESFRAHTLEKWGLDYQTLSNINKSIIVVHISGYGQTGPYSERPGFGSIAEAMSGFVNANGFPDQPPILPPIPLADELAGTFAAMSILMATYELNTGNSGIGQEIDVSLYEPLFRLLIPNVSQFDQLGILVSRLGNRFPDGAPRNLYISQDGKWIALSANTQGVWEQLAKAIEREDLINDPRFTTNSQRVTNVEHLDAIIQGWFSSKTMKEILDILNSAGAVVFPIYNTDQIMDDPQYNARGNIVDVPHDRLGNIKMPSPIPIMSRTPGSVHSPGPILGHDNINVYQEFLGISEADVDDWKEKGII